MGYKIINAKIFFEEKKGQSLKVREMKRINNETTLTPFYDTTLDELLKQVNMLKNNSKADTFELEVKSMKERYSVEVSYCDKNKDFIHIHIWTIEK